MGPLLLFSSSTLSPGWFGTRLSALNEPLEAPTLLNLSEFREHLFTAGHLDVAKGGVQLKNGTALANHQLILVEKDSLGRRRAEIKLPSKAAQYLDNMEMALLQSDPVQNSTIKEYNRLAGTFGKKDPASCHENASSRQCKIDTDQLTRRLLDELRILITDNVRSIELLEYAIRSIHSPYVSQIFHFLREELYLVHADDPSAAPALRDIKEYLSKENVEGKRLVPPPEYEQFYAYSGQLQAAVNFLQKAEELVCKIEDVLRKAQKAGDAVHKEEKKMSSQQTTSKQRWDEAAFT